MIKLSSKDTNVVQVSKDKPKQNVVQEKIVKDNKTHETREFTTNRPDIVDNPRPDFVRSTNWTPLRLSSNNSIIDHAKITTAN